MRPLASLLDAVAFLTRVPVPRRRRFDLAGAAWAFPVVGALLGLLVGGVGVLTTGPLGWFVAAALAVALEVLLTGALHLDGLADCADGTGGADRQARLRIMKDHSVGVYGVAAVVLALLLKVAVVTALLQHLSGEDGPGAGAVVLCTTVAWTLSRAAMLPLAVGMPYAREEGTGRALVEGLTGRQVAVALAVGAALVAGAVLVGAGLGVPAERSAVAAVTMVVAVLAAGLLTAGWARRTLGGVTGDVLGAAAETTLLTALLAGLAVL